MHKSKILLPCLRYLVLPCMIQGLAAQEADLHPRGIFETPQEGFYGADYYEQRRQEKKRIEQRRQEQRFQDEGIYEEGFYEDGLYARLPGSTQDSDSWKDYFGLSISASVSGESNVFLNNEDEQSDIIFTIAPTLTFRTPGLFGEDNAISDYITPRVSISYTPSYRMYSKNSELDGFNHSLRFNFNNAAGFDISLPKTTISFDLDYNQSQGTSRFSNGFTESQRLSSGVRVAHALSGKTSLNFGARASLNNFDSADLIDDITYNFNAALMYQATGKISIGPYVGYGISNLSGSAGGLQNTQDRHSYSAGATMNYQASGKTTFTGSVGWSTYEFSGPGATGAVTSGEGKSSVVWRAGVSHRLSPKITLRGSLWRDYKPSNNIVNTAYVATGLSLSAGYSQSDRLTHTATLTYENDDYFSDDPSGGTLNNDYYRITLGSNYRFNNGLSLGANVSSSAQSSNESANNFDNWIFSLYANYVFW